MERDYGKYGDSAQAIDVGTVGGMRERGAGVTVRTGVKFQPWMHRIQPHARMKGLTEHEPHVIHPV